MINQNVILHHVKFDSFAIFIDDPELGVLAAKYGCEVNIKISRPVKPGTEEQNRAMHALLTAYYVTGLHSAPEGYTLDAFKIYMKLRYGPVYQIEIEGQNVRVPKSWSDYDKDERRNFIDGLISEINQSGAFSASDKIREIILGMSDNFKI